MENNMNIAIGSDHGGFELKAFLVKELSSSNKVFDKGPAGRESCDYPDYAIAVAKDVASGAADLGVLICRSGIGMAMTANRFQNVRAATCATTEAALLIRTRWQNPTRRQSCGTRHNTKGQRHHGASSRKTRKLHIQIDKWSVTP